MDEVQSNVSPEPLCVFTRAGDGRVCVFIVARYIGDKNMSNDERNIICIERL